jgi:hypothetical protein
MGAAQRWPAPDGNHMKAQQIRENTKFSGAVQRWRVNLLILLAL